MVLCMQLHFEEVKSKNFKTDVNSDIGITIEALTMCAQD